MKLTDEQKESVLSVDGNVVVIASAGSGKTSSFTTRIAYMIQEKKISPFNILAITFTKKASEEMKKRLSKMIGKNDASKVEMGTFHSVAYRLLKAQYSEFNSIKIAPEWWRFSLLSDLCKDNDPRKNPNGLGLGIRAGELASFISYQKSNMISSREDVLIDDNVKYVDCVSRPMLQEAYQAYETIKTQSRQIDFDDMLYYLHKKLKEDNTFRERLAIQYKYIMVDEFQDTAKIVKEIIKMINDKNVFVVGDFRQSIYKFINADVENILNFRDEFKNTKLIELNKNFRSTQNIVGLSNLIISNSEVKRYNDYKPSESVSEKGEDVDFVLYNNENDQVEDITESIRKLVENGSPYSEIAVLVRTNAQTAILESVFADNDIPFDVSKSMSFYDRKEILDILSYARLALDPDDDASFRRIYNTPNRYLSKKFSNELDEFASEKGLPLLKAVEITPHNSEWKYRTNIESLLKIIKDLKSQVDSNVNAGRILRNIIKSTRYNQYLNDTTTSASALIEKQESIDKLCEIGAKFPSINAFLAHISKIKDKQEKSKGKDSVQVTTIHSAKGLEWDTVFVLNCNDGSIPHEMNDDEEEERRLFYVACSRPRKKLQISWCLYDKDYSNVKEGIFVREIVGDKGIKDMRKDLYRGSEKSVWKYSI